MACPKTPDLGINKICYSIGLSPKKCIQGQHCCTSSYKKYIRIVDTLFRLQTGLVLLLAAVCFKFQAIRRGLKGLCLLLNPFRTAVSCWGQSNQISSSLSPNRDCGSKGDTPFAATTYCCCCTVNKPKCPL